MDHQQARAGTRSFAFRPLVGAFPITVLILVGCRSASHVVCAPGPSPVGPVFLVPGVWPDGPSMWIDDVQALLRQRGIEGIQVPHDCFVFGYMFGYGTNGPADRMADFAEQFQVQHASTGCQAELRFCGIGLSAGTMMLLKAAERGVHFERVYFGGAPLSFWNADLARTLDEGRIHTLLNYYSPVDLVVAFTCGAGMFGYSGAKGETRSHVQNRRHWSYHAWPLWWNEARAESVVDEIAQVAQGPRHTCFQVSWFREWYLDAKERIETEW